ncbi:N-acetylmuramoyl-L-alanine amidase [Nocardioides montaniterrae]
MSAPQLGRRQVFGLAAAAAAAPSLALLPDLGRGALAAPSGSRLVLTPDSDNVTSALDIPIARASGRASTLGPVRSAVLETTGFSALGVTWASGDGVVRVRTRRSNGWTPWRTLSPIHDRPDADTDEGRATPRGTSLAWVGRSDAVQLEVEGSQVAPVLSLIDPGQTPVPATPDFGAEIVGRRSTAPARLPVPPLFGRGAWKPNPAFRNGPIERISSLRQLHVHHTDNANDYTWDEVPAMLRSIYRYHTQSLGWADIAYNFLVDRFGRIWVGRSGSVGKMARGAHTLGFNHCSVGVAVLGNFETGQANDKIYGAVARVAAWKLGNWDRNPQGRIQVTSKGSDKFPPGRRVVLPVIDGHRDTNDTACPGDHLYAHLDRIRERAAYRIEHHA